MKNQKKKIKMKKRLRKISDLREIIFLISYFSFRRIQNVYFQGFNITMNKEGEFRVSDKKKKDNKKYKGD